MDAPTTTSADEVRSGDSTGRGSRGGGWFGRSPRQHQGEVPRDAEGLVPSRPVTPIRPVGSGPDRSRTAHESPAQAAAHGRAQAQAQAQTLTPERVPPQAQASAPNRTQALAFEPAPALAPAPAPAPASEDMSATALLRRTMAEIEPIADKVTSHFYALLFLRHPDLRALFPAAMDAQRDRLFRALLTAATHAEDTETLATYLSHLGRGHRKYGTLPEHYPAVGECLIGALSIYAPQSWGPRTEAAWVGAYTTISQIMIDAAAKDGLRAPAWWQAEVVAHEIRTPDIAVVTVRPDQPHPFLAGQYTALETPWWPRIWRHYSFASAPRADGLLSFHVKAVPAGWVSNALVHRARPGDVIRLGAPAGSMTVDHSTDNGLLCLGGGTGIAPIKALVEDVAQHGHRRSVQVFYGARRDHDLYDIEAMLRMQQSHPWLSVRPVVDDSRVGALGDRLPQAVREYGPWHTYDAYLSGPPGMIRRGVDTLVGIGIPTHRIRHDSIEELVGARN
ncbi:globin domain-containing protein [Streptomyces sp. NPDC007863]|uniref:globin domain-containing protein n=1 Tax=Streptomyces sp. NPDC007863 TaxID=3154894 RepID=UPI0033ECBA04